MLSCWQKGAWSAMRSLWRLVKVIVTDSVCFGYLWIQLVHSCSVSFQLRKTLCSLWISLSPVQGSHCFQLKSKAFFHLLLQGRRLSGPFNNWHQFSKALNQALPCGFLNAEVPWTTLVHSLPQCTSPEHACDQYLQGSIDIPAWWPDGLMLRQLPHWQLTPQELQVEPRSPKSRATVKMHSQTYFLAHFYARKLLTLESFYLRLVGCLINWIFECRECGRARGICRSDKKGSRWLEKVSAVWVLEAAEQRISRLAKA